MNRCDVSNEPPFDAGKGFENAGKESQENHERHKQGSINFKFPAGVNRNFLTLRNF